MPHLAARNPPSAYHAVLRAEQAIARVAAASGRDIFYPIGATVCLRSPCPIAQSDFFDRQQKELQREHDPRPMAVRPLDTVRRPPRRAETTPGASPIRRAVRRPRDGERSEEFWGVPRPGRAVISLDQKAVGG